ncbi:MAG: D-alanyl-D-alanine carboxypeptidase/D-alanyl-D-alanine endopeptidase [Fermentimonas sp.]|jgi:D-alanyl-D-alanine carboxypeptidase/D-alanyl-D-alanine-endopeptidase (penicillin-binding protein 4)
MKKLARYLLLPLLVCLLPRLAYPQSLLQRFIDHPALKHASVGISVVELESGKSIVNHDAEKSLTPASLLKLITTATALEMLGENYRYKTKIAMDANDPSRILVLGGGDPTLGSEVFPENPYTFFINGVKALTRSLPTGREYAILVVDNLFGYDGISPEWTWIDIGNYYAAGAYGISIFDNNYKLVFNTMDRKSQPKILRTEPEIKGLTFQNSLTLNDTGRDNGYIYGVPFSYEKELRGDIPSGRSEFAIKGDIPDPGRLVGETLGEYLNQAGYQVGAIETTRQDHLSRSSTNEQKPPYRVGNVLFTLVSRPLKEIIREVNVESNNHYAEHLIRTIGRHANSDIYTNALTEGVDFSVSHWKDKGIDPSPLTMHDGSGLAPQNAVSARFLTDMLVYMYNRSNNSNAFFNSLPKAGQEGTLKNFLRDTRLTGKVTAKSGSIGGVQCFAGYLIDGEKKYAFTVMVNKFNGTRNEVRKAIEQFLLGL